jgi:hypothetical protein
MGRIRWTAGAAGVSAPPSGLVFFIIPNESGLLGTVGRGPWGLGGPHGAAVSGRPGPRPVVTGHHAAPASGHLRMAGWFAGPAP